MNKIARSITKWIKTCDNRLNRLISYIHYTGEYKQYCHVGDTAKQSRLGLFQDSDFSGDLGDPKSTSDGTLCVFGSRTFFLISWMYKKKLQFHTVQQNPRLFLDVGLRLNRNPALVLWDLIISDLETTCYHYQKLNISKENQRVK